MFPLKIFRNRVAVITFVSAVFFRTCDVTLQSVQTQQVLMHVCCADFDVQIRCLCTCRCVHTELLPYFTTTLQYQCVCVCVCVLE